MNLLMKRLGANYTLPLMVTLWGMVTACQGAVKSYGGLIACRFFLGALEGELRLPPSYAIRCIDAYEQSKVAYSPESFCTCRPSTSVMTCNSGLP